MGHIADRPLYADITGTRVLEHNHPDAAYLLVGEDSELDGETARKHGIEKRDGRLHYEGFTPTARHRAEDKLKEKSVDELEAQAREQKVELPAHARKAAIIAALLDAEEERQAQQPQAPTAEAPRARR